MDDKEKETEVLTSDDSIEQLENKDETSSVEEVKEKVQEEKEPQSEEIKEDKKEELVTEEIKDEPKEETSSTPGPMAMEPVENNESKPEKKKKKHTGLVIFLIILAILGILACLFLPGMLGKKVEGGKVAVDKEEKASPYRITSNSLEDFDLYFLQLENNGKNTIYSPLSIKYALAMLNEGTDGESHKQIANIIGEYKAKKYNNNEHMSFANAMFIRDTFKDAIRTEYTDKLKETFGAEIFTEDFSSATPMNDWVSSKTFKLIDSLLDDDTVKGENFVLVNALAIDMNWNNQLQCKEGRTIPCMNYYVKYKHEKYNDHVNEIFGEFEKVDFNGKDVSAATIGASINKYDIIKDLGEDNIYNTVKTELQEYVNNGGEMCSKTVDEFMNEYMDELKSNYKRIDQSTDFLFYENEDVKTFAKDLKTYDGTTLQYVGIMPTSVSLTEYIKTVDAKSVNTIISNLKPIALESFKDGVVTKIHGNIPFFKYDYKINLIKDLEELGITDIFDIEKADMSKMLNGERQMIDDARHKAMIEFSNDGIKAAAATSMGGAGAAGCYIEFDHEYDVPVEEIDLTFNKPYMYVIRDKDTGEVWFTGAVFNPE